MRDTSNLAYAEINASGQAETQRERIYRFLEALGPVHVTATRNEIANALGIPLSAVCGRVHELLEAGRIEELERRRCMVTGYQAHPLRVRK